MVFSWIFKNTGVSSIDNHTSSRSPSCPEPPSLSPTLDRPLSPPPSTAPPSVLPCTAFPPSIGPRRGAAGWTAQIVAHLFAVSHPTFHYFLLGHLVIEFRCLECWGSPKTRVGSLGHLVNPQQPSRMGKRLSADIPEGPAAAPRRAVVTQGRK